MSYDDDEVMLNVLRCQLTYQRQAETDAEARFNIALRPRKPEGSLGRPAQDGHLDSHTAPELRHELSKILPLKYGHENSIAQPKTDKWLN